MPEIELQVSQVEIADVQKRASESGLTLRDWLRQELQLPDHAASAKQQEKEDVEHLLRQLESQRRVREILYSEPKEAPEGASQESG